MAEQFTFDRIQMQRLVRQLVRDELGPRESYFTRPIPQEPVIEHLVGTAYGTITARSSGTPGTGQVQAKKFRSGTAADYADAPGNLVDVLNFGPAIATGSYVVCERHRETGKWLVDLRQERSVRYGIGSSNIIAGASSAVGITGETTAATGGIFSVSSGEAVIAPIGRYMAGFEVGFGNSGTKTEVVPLIADFQFYDSGLMSWGTFNTARGYYLGYLTGADSTVTLTGVCIFDTSEANQHFRMYATNQGATDSVNVQNYSHLWLKALDA